MIDLTTAKIGDKFITRNGMVVEYVHCQTRFYGISQSIRYIPGFLFVWYMTPEHPKFIIVNQNGLEWSPFESKWDIVRKYNGEQTPVKITIY